jgi:hypothetical protein
MPYIVGRGVRPAAIFARSSISVLAGASLVAILALGAPGQALAACGTSTTTTGGGVTQPPSAKTGVGAGSHAPSGSTGTSSSCPGGGTTGNGIKTTALRAGTLSGVHPATGITGNGGKKTTTSTTTGAVTHTHVASVVTGPHIRHH